MRFKDKVAIVAGGSQGIGEAIAVDLGAEGANVQVWDINEEGAQAVVKKIEAGNGKADATKINAMDYAEVAAGINQVVKDYGKLDIMICTVGGGKMVPFEYCTFDLFKQQLDFQIDPVFNCAHAALTPMKAQNYGYMLFFVSSTGGQPVLPGYQAGKAAVQSIIQSVAAELELFRIKVNINGILPGMVDTPLTRGAFAAMPGGEQRLKDSIAAKARGISLPEYVASVALFLVSDDAHRVSGQVVQMF